MDEPVISFHEARKRSLEKWRKIREAFVRACLDISKPCGFCIRWGMEAMARDCESCEAYELCMADDSLHERISILSVDLETLVDDLIDALEKLEPPAGEEG